MTACTHNRSNFEEGWLCPICGYNYSGALEESKRYCPNSANANDVKHGGKKALVFTEFCWICRYGLERSPEGLAKAPTNPATAPVPEGFERVQQLLAELGPLLWNKGFIMLGGAIPFEMLTDEKKIKENAGSPLYVDLSADILSFENFLGLGVTGAARLKVALFMHMIEVLQGEILADAKTDITLDSLSVKNRDKN